MHTPTYIKLTLKMHSRGFLGGSVVKNLPGKVPHAVRPPSPGAVSTEPQAGTTEACTPQ